MQYYKAFYTFHREVLTVLTLGTPRFQPRLEKNDDEGAKGGGGNEEEIKR